MRSDEAVALSNIRGRRLAGDTALVPLVVDQSHQHAGRPLAGRPLARLHLGCDRGASRSTSRRSPSISSTRLVSTGGGNEPRWARSGRELFYKSGGHLMAVDVTPGSRPSRPARPTPLFSLAGYRAARNRPQYDVAPDDRRFLMIREFDDGSGEELVYVENWFPELKAKVKQ